MIGITRLQTHDTNYNTWVVSLYLWLVYIQLYLLVSNTMSKYCGTQLKSLVKIIKPTIINVRENK